MNTMKLDEKELRELDAWIAENVFGYQRQKFDNGHHKVNHLVPNKFRADKYRKHGFHEGVPLLETFPKYSTCPAAAMQVLEKCAMKLSPKRLHIYTPTASIDKWMVANVEANCEFPSEAIAETLPLAIALFAKKLFSATTIKTPDGV